MNELTQDCDAPPTAGSSMSARVEPVVFYVNFVLAILGTILIYRQQQIVLDLFNGFGVELSSLTEWSLTPPVLALLPGAGIVAIGLHTMPMCAKRKLAFQLIIFMSILAVVGLFLSATVPVTMNLIKQLEA